MVVEPHAVWAFAGRIGGRLLVWSGASIAAAAAFVAFSHPTSDALAIQFAVWGAIDAAIALLGERDRRRRLTAGEGMDAAATARFRARLARVLWLAALSDVGYVAIGIAIFAFVPTPTGVGHALGVLIQGGFLLVFDVWHARRIPD
jgi:hypothetical protein